MTKMATIPMYGICPVTVLVDSQVSDRCPCLCFPMTPQGVACMAEAWLAGFIKRVFIRCYTQKICFSIKICFFHCKSMGANDPWGGVIFDPSAWFAVFIKRITMHCFIQNMEALVVSEKNIFLWFSHDAPGVGPVWTPGAWLAGFMKRTNIHCYTQNMNALGLVVLKKKIFNRFFSL